MFLPFPTCTYHPPSNNETNCGFSYCFQDSNKILLERGWGTVAYTILKHVNPCSRVPVIEGITDQKTVSTKYGLGLKTLWLKYSLEYLDPFTIYVDGTDVSKETESSS